MTFRSLYCVYKVMFTDEEYDCSHIYEDIDQVIQQAEIQNESVIPKPETEPRYVPLPLRFSHSSRNKTIERGI